MELHTGDWKLESPGPWEIGFGELADIVNFAHRRLA